MNATYVLREGAPVSPEALTVPLLALVGARRGVWTKPGANTLTRKR
jgi:hypothetical protein